MGCQKMSDDKKIRVVIAKPGLDGHDRGAKVICQALRDEGFEVIYTGIRQTPEAIVSTVVQEDAAVLGLSVLSGAHLLLCRRISALLREKGKGDVLLLIGGIIPEEDHAALRGLGFARVFPPGTKTGEIAAFIGEHCPPGPNGK
jgi:methylmalonyl-CoA mutase C-terminal domain/subunit